MRELVAVLYVDLEHERVLRDPALASKHRSRIEKARGRLADAAGEGCVTIRAEEVSPGRIADATPSAIVLSGCTTGWDAYDLSAWEALLHVIREGSVPTLGICAGHQLIGFAAGAAWGPLGPLREGEDDPDPSFVPGHRKQTGFREVAVDPRCPLFSGLSETTVFQSHYWQLEEVPAGFVRRASSAWSPIQAMERLDRPVFGVQFHPERFDEAHPAGRLMLRNFFAAARASKRVCSTVVLITEG